MPSIPTVVVTIDGTQTSFDEGTFQISETINGRNTLHGVVRSEDATFRPTINDPVSVVEAGDTIFAGIVDVPEEQGIGGIGGVAILTGIDAIDNNEIAERRLITQAFPAGTLKSFLQLIVPYFASFGVTLDAAQVNGPSFPALEVMNVKGVDLLNDLSAMSGDDYLWEIGYDLKLRMYQPGTVVTPFDIVEGDGKVNGDIVVRRQRGTYVNRVIVRMGSSKQEIVQPFVGNGAQTTFVLDFPIGGIFPFVGATEAVGYAVVDINVFESLGGLTSPMDWKYDPADPQAPTIFRSLGAPSNLQAFNVRYQAEFPYDLVVEDLVEQGLHGIYEAIVPAPNLYDHAAAVLLGQGYLERGLATPVFVKYLTNELGLHPGMVQHINIPIRGLNGYFLLTGVESRHTLGIETVREVTAVGGYRVPGGAWRGVVKAWSGGGTVAGPSPNPAGGLGPGGVPRNVQYHAADGTFGGDPDFLFDFDGGGDVGYGVEVTLPARMAVASDEAYLQFVIANRTAGLDTALTFWLLDGDGTAYIEHDSTGGLAIFEYGGRLDLRGLNIRHSPGAMSLNYANELQGLTRLNALAVSHDRKTASFTISASTLSTAYLCAPSSGITADLPDLDLWAGALSGQGRILTFENEGAANTTLDGDSSELIYEGAVSATTLVLAPGQGVGLIAWRGTNPGWRVIWSHGRSPAAGAGGSGDVVGPAASVDKEIALFDGTTGKLLERATGTGLVRVSSGVYGTPGNAVESEITLVDNTTNDVSTTRHGFTPKLPNDSTKFLRGDGAYAVPPGGGTGAPDTLTYLTVANEVANLANSRRVLAGAEMFFDDATANVRTLRASRTPFTAPVSGDFSWVNQGSSSVRDDTDSFVLIGAATGSGANAVLRVKTAPATPYVITVKIAPMQINKAFNSYGLCFRESGTGEIHVLDVLSTGGDTPLVRSAKFTSATSFSAVYQEFNAPFLEWLRIADNGTNRICSISKDGVDWIQIHSIGRTDFLTANQVGIMISTENSVTPNVAPIVRVESWVQT